MKPKLTAAALLRQKAEEQLKNKPNGGAVLPLESETIQLFHELDVHQIELQMQFDELSKTHQIISEAKQEYNDLFDYAPFGYLLLTKDGTIKKLNYNAAAMLGKERTSLTEKRFGLFVSEETLWIFNWFLGQMFSDKAKQSCELVIKPTHSEPLFVHLEGMAPGTATECMLTMIDISSRKQKEHTIEMQNQALQELNAAKDKFFSIIAGDLRNPFVSIIGLSEMLARQALEMPADRIRKLAGYICDAASQTHELMENLFDWARLQTGSLVPLPSAINMTELINEVVAQCSPAANIKDIALKTTIQSEITFKADKDMTSAVLRNLINNAIKFTHPQGSIHVKLNVSKDVAVFIVTDTGIGMSHFLLDNLFRIDSMISHLGTANEKGTGLGLILCKEFVEKQGGAIHVKSKVGEGSEFSFTLPID